MSRKPWYGGWLVFLIGLLPLTSPADSSEWEEIPHCTLAKEDYRDGDSFQVYFEDNKRRKYILRLYFVDAPETDSRYPDRLHAQATYFGCGLTHLQQTGEAASERVAEWLDTPFTVYTQRVKAGGASSKPRYYAMIRCADGEWLSQKLVKAGLVRIYGKTVKPPTGEAVYRFLQDLQEREKDAQTAGVGGWASVDPETPVEPVRYRVLRPTTIFHSTAPHRPMGRLRAGQEFEHMGVAHPPYEKVRVHLPDDRVIEGLMHRSSLANSQSVADD